MFRSEKNFNDIFKVFDEMFGQLESQMGNWKTQTKVSDDGTYRITSYYYGNKDNTPPVNSKVDNLKTQLEIAIEKEDFEKAVELRDQIKKMESNQNEIQKLELELKKSIEEQNFEKSIEIRDQLKMLR